MKVIAISAALLTASFVAAADAQVRGAAQERLSAMRSQNSASYDACHALAVQRGYNDVDQESDGQALMHFISGCIMGQQR